MVNKLYKTIPKSSEGEYKGVNTSAIGLEVLCKDEVKLGNYPPERELLYTCGLLLIIAMYESEFVVSHVLKIDMTHGMSH